MAKVIVLGGCGAVGSVAVKTLVKNQQFSEVIIADHRIDKAEQLSAAINSKKVSTVSLDATNIESVKKAVKGCDVVLNCVGPFYNTVKPVLTAVIESGINYVDVCDDVDVTLEILDMDAAAKKAGISAVIGMGSSPGVTNLLGKYAAEQLLDEADAVDIYHAHGGEPVEGEGVIGHRFHCMSIDIPMFLEGELKYVKYFREDGIALRETFTFPVLGPVPLYPYPHPEQVTMPKHMKLKRVTNKGSVLPNEYYDLTRELCRFGLNSKEPIQVRGQSVVPWDFAMAFIIRERERILKEVKFGSQRGCVSVIVRGRKEGKYQEYRFHLASTSQALGEGTGIPAAMGAILMNRGKVYGKGVMPPEACINPSEFIGMLPEVMDLDKKKMQQGESFTGFIVEKVDEKGNVTKVDF